MQWTYIYFLVDLQGGGHSPISGSFGLAAEHALEFTVVKLTDGSVTKVNQCTEPDLWWALRGGGGSTYAVVVSATLQTYPSVGTVAVGRLELNVTDASGLEPWVQANIYMHKNMGVFSEAGFHGFYYVLSEISHTHWDFFYLNHTGDELTTAMTPYLNRLKEIGENGTNFATNFIVQSVPWDGLVKVFSVKQEFQYGEPL